MGGAGAGPCPRGGPAQPELLLCWESLSLHPAPRAACKQVPDTSPPSGVLDGDWEGREEAAHSSWFHRPCVAKH